MDKAKLNNSIVELVEYSWDEELEDFEETYEVEIQSQDDLTGWIEWCETADKEWNKETQGASPINHVFYHLMVIKDHYKELFNLPS